MDKLLGVVQSYEGKADTTMELMLNMQKNFEEELKTPREENGEIKAWIEGKKNNSEKEKTPERFAEGEESQGKNQGEKDWSTKQTHQKTKEPKKTKENEISDTASSCTKTRKTEPLRGKKSVRLEDEM